MTDRAGTSVAARDPLTFSVHVRGDAVSAWLTAGALARFVLPSTAVIAIEETHPLPSGPLVLRPDMRPFHHSLDLDIARLPGSKPVGAWTASGRSVPLSSFGASLGGVDFPALWARARHLGSSGDLWAFSGSEPVDGLYEVLPETYLSALQKTLQAAGVFVEAGVPASPDLVVDTLMPNPGDNWESGHARVGAAAVPVRYFGPFGVLALQCTLRSLISNWTDAIGPQAEHREYARYTKALAEHFSDMQALLEGAPEMPPRLVHRIETWRELGRIVPVDHDPFTAPEWMAALLHAGHRPSGYLLRAESLPEAAIHRHLTDHIKESAYHG